MAEAPRSRKRARPAPSPLRIWLSQHLSSAASSIVRLLLNPGAALFTTSAMALALSLPLGLWLVLANLEQLSGSVEASRNLDLFLTTDITDQHAAALAQQLRAWDSVVAVEHQTPAQGLDELRRREGWGEIGELVPDDNPLPHRLRVVPAGEAGALVAALKALPEVDLLQHDAQWRQRLEDWLEVGRRLAWVLAALFGLGALLVVVGSVRADIQTRRDDMQVLHLIGATGGFIRRPFLYLGAWYGLIAGALAIAVLAGAKASLHAPVAALAASYHSNFALRGLTLEETALILSASAALGWLGAALVSAHALRGLRAN